MYGTFRTRTWWGTETTKVSGNMLPDWTLIDRAGLVEHLTAETQRLHPDRCVTLGLSCVLNDPPAAAASAMAL